MLQYFSMQTWDFRVEKLLTFRKYISEEENEIFPSDLDEPNISEYLKDCILGGRQFCLKEDLSSLPKARAQLKM